MFIKTPLLLFRQLPDVFLTMVKSFLYAKNKAKKIQEKKEESKAGKREKEREEGKAKREREKKKGKKDKTGKTERAKKEERKTTKSEMEKSRKLFAATRLTLGFLGTNFFTFIIMKNYIVGKGVLFL
jgi:hypothetical protein